MDAPPLRHASRLVEEGLLRVGVLCAKFNDGATVDGEESNFHELAIYTVLIHTYNRNLLYALIGDPPSCDKADQPSKLDILLDPEASVIAKVLSEFLHMLQA